MSSTKQPDKETPFGLENLNVGEESPFPDPVVLPLEDVLDLHPFQPKEIRSVVEEYLTECCTAGFTSVRLIHGKGKGVQRESIRALLARLPFVASFQDAPPDAGGWGATLVLLNLQGANPQKDP